MLPAASGLLLTPISAPTAQYSLQPSVHSEHCALLKHPHTVEYDLTREKTCSKSADILNQTLNKCLIYEIKQFL